MKSISNRNATLIEPISIIWNQFLILDLYFNIETERCSNGQPMSSMRPCPKVLGVLPPSSQVLTSPFQPCSSCTQGPQRQIIHRKLCFYYGKALGRWISSNSWMWLNNIKKTINHLAQKELRCSGGSNWTVIVMQLKVWGNC